MARQGKALARYLSGQGARVTLNDLKRGDELAETRQELADLDLGYELGGHPLRLLEEADALFLSGGVPADIELAQEARRRQIPVSNDSQLFLELTPAGTVGITGSAGKSTTTALLGAMAEEADQAIWMGGNLGRPLLLDLPEMEESHVAIMELSSFQLELMTRSPNVAAILNITPNHLDRHGDIERYTQAKARILDYQSDSDDALLGHGDPIAWDLRTRVRGRLWSFGWEEPPMGRGAYLDGKQLTLRDGDDEEIALLEVEELGLRGQHNILNTLAALTLGHILGIPASAMRRAAMEFAALPHRLEAVAEVDGVLWINDSIATTPERAIAGIRSFDRPLVLLAGGRDKGLDWSAFAQEVGAKVRHVITFGEARGIIQAAIAKSRGAGGASIRVAPDLASAVAVAAQVALPGDVVLLSPGGTSFDEFVDFEARGERFRQLVMDL
jgi:UDP-N-acetylmuramoylalanine--D-glutamate ligase